MQDLRTFVEAFTEKKWKKMSRNLWIHDSWFDIAQAKKVLLRSNVEIDFKRKEVR